MKLLLIGLGLLSTLFASAQQANNKRARKFYDQSSVAISAGKLEEALPMLQQAINEDSTFIEAYQRKGDILRKLNRYREATKAYQKVLSLDSAFTPLTLFGYAESLFYQTHYAEAKVYFARYRQSTSLQAASIARVNKFIDDCNFAIQAQQSSEKVDVKPLGKEINTAASEYFPSLTANNERLLFTRRKDSNEDIYESQRNSGQWLPARPVQGLVNTAQNEGSECISADGQWLFFTGCNRSDGLGRCDIYICRRQGEGWSAPYNPGAPLNTSAWESQPSLSADGNTLFFVSNRPGGYGGYDIWYSEINDDGSFSPPRNAGPNINTAFDEHSPFIHHDNRSLFFSSNGWPGFGLRDLFLSRRDSLHRWARPINLGSGINSAAEESTMFVSSDGKNAYFASSRSDSTGNMDIFNVELPEALRAHPIRYIKGIVVDSQNKNPIAATIELYSTNDYQRIYRNHIPDGYFLLTIPDSSELELTASAKGYSFRPLRFHNIPQDSLITIAMDKLEAGRSYPLDHIFFEINSATLLPQSSLALKHLIALLESNPGIKIEISGHTDNTGNASMNIKLSEARATAVYNYLIVRGINASRLTHAGFGDQRPLTSNDSAEGRSRNRRTEFKILTR